MRQNGEISLKKFEQGIELMILLKFCSPPDCDKCEKELDCDTGEEGCVYAQEGGDCYGIVTVAF